MLYSDVIYLLLSIVLFSSWPREGRFFFLENAFFLWVFKELAFVWLAFLSLKKSREIRSFLRRQAQLKALAFIFFASDVILFNLPSVLVGAGLTNPFLLDLGGLLLFLHYFGLIWFISGLFERRSPLNTLPLSRYFWAHFRLLLPFVLPWLMVNSAFEVLDLFWQPPPSSKLEIAYFSAFLVALIFLVPPLAAKLWDCYPLPESRLRRLIEDYLKREKAFLKEIYLWRTFGGKLLTAGVIGVIPRFRYLLISPGLLAALEEVEILSVVAHEVGHLKRHHMFWLLAFFLFFTLLVYLTFSPLFFALLAYFPKPVWLVAGQELFLPEAIFSLGLVLSVVLYFRFLFGFFIRNFERQADLYCLESLGTAEGLIRSLKKIAVLSGNTHDLPSWHHYSIQQRIDFLKEATRDPSLIKRHHRKVKKALICYVLVIAILSFGASHFSDQELERKAHLNLTLGELLKEACLSPSPEIFSSLASLYYELGREKEAWSWFQKALLLAPEDPELLNNLAWLLVTAKDPRLRDPEKGLALALEATQKRPLATHLDTLAEALWLNGQEERACLFAILAWERARLAPDYYPNRDYYLRQKKRFCAP